MVARPSTKLGLTAKKAANLMLEGSWDTFGVPTQITSDMGAQFVGQWWRTLCARLGIRQAYSQAHRPQANGCAERAGQQIIELLKKLNVEQNVIWVEALPRVLVQYHDVVGEGGLSPYQIVFGRDRLGLGVPYPPERSCEDAESFLDRMRMRDEFVAQRLNAKHLLAAEQVNKGRKARADFAVGDKVWLLKPKSLSSQAKLEARWVGPMRVVHRLGRSSYSVVDYMGTDMMLTWIS